MIIKKKNVSWSDDEESESLENEKNIINQKKLQPLKQMNLDFQTISEDPQKIVVLLKLKPKQVKEPQLNVAGAMVTQ